MLHQTAAKANSFIESEIEYDFDLLPKLSELEIQFIDDEGKLFDSEKSEHSFMLEITEIITDFKDSNLLDRLI